MFRPGPIAHCPWRFWETGSWGVRGGDSEPLSHAVGVTGWRVLFCCYSKWKAVGDVKQSLPFSSWQCPSWDTPAPRALLRRREVNETGALTLSPALRSAKWAQQQQLLSPALLHSSRSVAPQRQRCSHVVFTGAPGWHICIFTTIQMRRGA